ncbi:MAG: hypothetical protein D4R67_12900 [Bacteroidetes bacterium]|nr:MAG: hypothetical protein D4R67_12900 [Bacteroidota bacterium]
MRKQLGSLFFISLIVFVFLGAAGCKKKETTIPVVVTDPLSSVTTTSARGGGLVLDNGGGEILARGICWSVQPSPTVADGNATAGSGMGYFTATLTGLTPDTRYYVRTYATNEVGTGYSDQLILQTMFGTVKDIDGNTYQTVHIGVQEWMAQNLKVTHFNNGVALPNITDYAQWAQLTSGAFAWYGNDYQTYGQYYGALYNWYALTDPRSICPDDWHIPSVEEWDTLFYQLGGALVAGGKLKSALTALYQHPYWIPPNYLGTNESGFSAFPGGFRSYIEGVFSGLGPSGYWWSSTPDTLDIKGIWLSTNSANAFTGLFNRNSGASVRCVRD